MDSKILESFGKKLREIRLKKGMTQEDLAEKADVHRTYIGMVERAEKNVTLKNINKIANALGVSIPDLLPKNENS